VLAAHEALMECGMDCPFTLTEKYPNLQAFRRLSALHPTGIFFDAQPVDATTVPRELAGLRTMFNAFHHFPPESAPRVLECAVEARQPIAIFEIPDRRIAGILPLILTPLFVALATPAIRPFGGMVWFLSFAPIPLRRCWNSRMVSTIMNGTQAGRRLSQLPDMSPGCAESRRLFDIRFEPVQRRVPLLRDLVQVTAGCREGSWVELKDALAAGAGSVHHAGFFQNQQMFSYGLAGQFGAFSKLRNRTPAALRQPDKDR